MDKKGMTLGNLYPAAILIIVIGIALGLGIYVLDQTSEAISTETLTTLNETVTTLATAGDALAAADDCGAHDFVELDVANATSGATVPTSNYTFDTTSGVIYGVGVGGYVGQNVNVSYSYTGTSNTATTGACGTMSTSSTGISGFASWIAVICVVIAAAVVLGIVISSFGRSRGV